MLTHEESVLVNDLHGLGAHGMANLIRQRGLIQLLRDMGFSDLVLEPTAPKPVDEVK